MVKTAHGKKEKWREPKEDWARVIGINSNVAVSLLLTRAFLRGWFRGWRCILHAGSLRTRCRSESAEQAERELGRRTRSGLGTSLRLSRGLRARSGLGMRRWLPDDPRSVC